ncbi:Xaa-Pro dipeptidase [Saccharopolyspora erythraea NRRL 2338]|uniref:Xaa-Pro peptidase family protein n=2 Tax=Saccharopolyspora erythraea TaxID=1836 RepID=A0ABN1DBT3_SACER|nr:Xaa-Pro peptidase family protein [Saccharopolyspora erythraea]EQD84643.1 dipeptidase [Saccharopolyspora erythraea D]PFG95355.1 Xaa-Pro dipeptidase [Saccharopolyspora erythraea NRRL 2338]QRK91997.1 aminopeptidase P family protein [Saccharopolyspora erythraea]CAM01583.1 probable Xaa-Pro dipeptidase [Saccharopolyspora erythraea NRRL 2338]
MATVSMKQDPSVLAARLGRAAETAAGADLDALLISPGSDLRYLIGAGAGSFERLSCLVLPAAGHDAPPALVLPKLEELGYADVPASELGIEVVTWVDGENPYAIVTDLLRRGGAAPARVAVADVMPALHTFPLRDALPGAEQVLAGGVLRELRMRKDAAEVEALRKAGAAIDRVHARMAEFLKAGRTEAEVGADITEAIVAEGHVEAAFVIVGSGPNGASPHHALSDRVVQEGDVVVIDIGGPIAEGYNSDCTRTYAVGEPSQDDVRDTYAVLQAAQRAAVEAVRPGVTAESIDAAAREPIAAAGFGDFFVHRTGHGIGLDVHEDPYVVDGDKTVLEPGMAFSVEPGIYQPGRWGARIEDIVIVTEDGVESVNNQPHELIVLPA